jgi:hypothetical protein
MLYGDPMAYRLIYSSAIFPRDSPLTWPEFFQINLPWLWQTFWGGPTPGDFSSLLLVLFAVLSLVGAIGAITFFFSSKENQVRLCLALLAAWLTLIFAAQVEFIRTSGGTDQGRYLFPAIGSFAILTILGFENWVSRLVPRRLKQVRAEAGFRGFARPRLLYIAFISAMATLSLLVLFVNTIPAYARPPQVGEAILGEADRHLDVNFSNLFALRGYSLSTRNLRAGESLKVTLYWQSLGRTRISYRVFVHLVGQKGRVAGGKDVVPDQGAYATVLWQPGDWIQDSITFATAPDAYPGTYQLEVGLYPFGQPDNRLNLAGSDQDHVLVDAIEVAR